MAGGADPPDAGPVPAPDLLPVPLTTIVREWGRIGCLGFGGPPTHIKMLRDLCVQRRKWLSPEEFEDAIAVCNLLPGPASTQLAISARGGCGAVSAPWPAVSRSSCPG